MQVRRGSFARIQNGLSQNLNGVILIMGSLIIQGQNFPCSLSRLAFFMFCAADLATVQSDEQENAQGEARKNRLI